RSASQDWEGLTRLAEEILRRRSADVTMMGNLVSLYRKTGRYPEAHAMLDRAFAIGIDALRLHLLRAEVALGEHDFPRALQAAAEAARLDPRSARAHGVRSRALLMLQRPSEAVEAMERSLQLQPDDPGNLQVLGEAFLAQGDLDGAERAYRASLALAESEFGRQRLAQLAEKRTSGADSR
ncbi:tetratricopeptide repeat protein, partial [bacterium]|nr:tetratricopeptide repeat protein [bacterium]